ncbi:MAG: NADAR family protein [Lachnospiraceae bacterium]|nr:NADAR family protein [Lachnospiraceae bacterium]
MNIIGFHNPDEEYGFLSNWYLSNFSVLGVEYSSMEQYMMYQKAICFHDDVIAAEILKINDVSQIKQLGRLVSGYNDNVWNGVRQIVVYEGLIAKFSQNDELRKSLIDTGDATLAECAVKDKIWGIGLSMTDPDRVDIVKWRGQNLLGYALMMVRSRLQA